jgi:hypothetical protein
VSGAVVDGKLFFNIFSEVRAVEHAKIKKPIAKYFSPNGVAPLEPHVDAVLASLCGVINDRFAGTGELGQPFDFGKWVLFCMSLPASLHYGEALTTCPSRRLGRSRQDDLESTSWLSGERVRL